MAYFIVFEGLDGTGKSSLIQGLAAELQTRQIPFHLTREPGGTPLGEALRPLIMDKNGPHPGPRAELLLYQASRAQHVDEIIRPKLAANNWVISDRFTASSIAFQSGGRDLPLTHVEWLNEFATEGLRPDLTVLLDLSVEEARARRRSRSGADQEDRIEAEADLFHEKVRRSFLAQAEREPDRWLVLSAKLTPDELKSALLAELKGRQWLD